MKLKKLFTCVASFMLAVALVGCGGSSSGSTDSTGGEVAVFWYTFGDTYLSSVRSAMNATFYEKGIKYQDYDANASQTTQTEQITTAISKGASCLVVNIVDASSDDATQAIIN